MESFVHAPWRNDKKFAEDIIYLRMSLKVFDKID